LIFELSESGILVKSIRVRYVGLLHAAVLRQTQFYFVFWKLNWLEFSIKNSPKLIFQVIFGYLGASEGIL